MVDPAGAAKAAAAAEGVRRVRPGQRLALGSGTTAEHAIRGLAARFQPGELPEMVASSESAERIAREVGLPVRPLRGGDRFDLMLDGADEVAPDLSLTKGGGGALFREKLLARLSAQLIVLVDPSKLVDRLGVRHRIPVEVVPWALESVRHQLAERGAEGVARTGPDGRPFRSDNGGAILDVAFPGGVAEPGRLEAELRAVPGVVESGLFVGLTSRVLVGHSDGRVEERRAPDGRLPPT